MSVFPAMAACTAWRAKESQSTESTVDAGTLTEGRRYEPGTPAYGAPYGTFEDPTGTPADPDKLRSALAEAK